MKSTPPEAPNLPTARANDGHVFSFWSLMQIRVRRIFSGFTAALTIMLSPPTRAASSGTVANPDPDGVTFESILKNPDDLELNIAYAQAEVRRGNLRSAMATLERVLLAEPGLHAGRLFYAQILYRLDDMASAWQEVQALERQELPPDLRRRLGELRRRVNARLRRTRLSGRLAAGYEYNENKNLSPSSGRVLFLDVPLNLDSPSLRRGDANAVFLAGLGARHDLDTSAGHELLADVSYYRSEQDVIKTLNMQAYSVQSGILLKLPFANLTATGLFDHVLLAQSTYLRDRGYAFEPG